LEILTVPIRQFAHSKDGLKLRYEVRGSGAPVALIMGFSGSGHAWSERFLNLLEKHFKLVVIDNRGTGESDKPDVAWTLRDMANDIAAVLDDAKLPRTHILGISMGGMIAQEYVLAYPERVQRLVLGCTNCGMSHSIPGKPEDLARLMPQPGMSPADAARAAFSVACGKAFTASETGQKFIEEQMIEAAKYPITPPHTFTRQFGAISGFDSHARLAQIKVPTLILQGDDDAIVPVQNADVLNQGIADSRKHILRGIGHMFFWEAPGESTQVAIDFLTAN
jgi:pimeloyl-ACP methyl ester carboxylesterase